MVSPGVANITFHYHFPEKPGDIANIKNPLKNQGVEFAGVPS
jgi:hypothetical protein